MALSQNSGTLKRWAALWITMHVHNDVMLFVCENKASSSKALRNPACFNGLKTSRNKEMLRHGSCFIHHCRATAFHLSVFPRPFAGLRSSFLVSRPAIRPSDLLIGDYEMTKKPFNLQHYHFSNFLSSSPNFGERGGDVPGPSQSLSFRSPRLASS